MAKVDVTTKVAVMTKVDAMANVDGMARHLGEIEEGLRDSSLLKGRRSPLPHPP